MNETGSRPSWGMRIIAIVVLAIAAWVLFKLVIGTVVAIAWIGAIIVAIIGVFWALAVLRS